MLWDLPVVSPKDPPVPPSAEDVNSQGAPLRPLRTSLLWPVVLGMAFALLYQPQV